MNIVSRVQRPVEVIYIQRFDFYRPTIMPSPYTRYQEYPPSPFLQPYICCYWSAAPYENQVNEYTYDIIPDGCTDLLYEYDKATGTSSIKYYGIFECPFRITEQYNPDQYTFGIRFFPGSSSYFIHERAKDTAANAMDLNQITSPDIQRLHHYLDHASGVNEMIAACDEVFSQAIKCGKLLRHDSLLTSILYQIVVRRGQYSIEELSHKEVIGQRRMNRLFEERIGLSPKKFSQVIRFQSVLTDWLTKTPADFLAEEYYDQSHMIHDFKKRTGKSPRSLKVSDFYNTSDRLPGKL
ncbi:helix-turn-helix domain-containing protein [Bacillus salacetis]|uniref:helix-turn-helix domain-containing protein n=1 Tax=Bacillus salacetis TaxID=2315464 RepID=UPI001443BED3|nr:helix-turn-helix domain-containing protein [Bacillus salacetis]